VLKNPYGPNSLGCKHIRREDELPEIPFQLAWRWKGCEYNTQMRFLKISNKISAIKFIVKHSLPQINTSLPLCIAFWRKPIAPPWWYTSDA
jgi:hypothetical protein